MPNTTEDDELITDLEAFHRKLQTSVGSVRDMVASWMPAQSAKNAFPDALENNEDFAPFRGRPDRLGLGLERHSSVTTAHATAHPDSVEGKLFRGITQSGKKRKAEESESIQSPAAVAKIAKATTSKASGNARTSNGTIANTGRDDDNDEESRTKSIKAKPSRPPIPTNSFFRDSKAAPAKTPSASAKKSESAKASDIASEGTKTKPLASPAKDKHATKAVPASPGKVSPVKPPYAIPPSQLDQADMDDSAPSPSVDESTVTEATESTQAVTTGEAAKKKRKRNKKKKNKQGQAANGESSQAVQPEKLFGNSVIE